MQCYVCCTPYALFLALNICNPKESDLFIANQFKSADKIVKALKEKKIFHNVILIDEEKLLHFKYSKLSKFSIYNRINMIWRYLFLKSYMKRSEFQPCYYEALYFSYSFMGRMMYLYSKKMNASVQCFRFEDGVGDYVVGYEAGITKRDKLARKLIGVNADDFEILLTCPELYLNKEGKKVSRILFKYKDPEIAAIINTIFPCNKDNWKYGTVYFDTVRKELPDQVNRQMDEMLDKLKLIMVDNFIIKSHPRETTKRKGFEYWVCEENQGFEIDCCNHDFSGHTLITITSTAVFIPKMIFGQEPVVILLYKLFDFTKDWDETYFVDRYKNLYHNSDRVIVPENFEQLYEVLQDR